MNDIKEKVSPQMIKLVKIMTWTFVALAISAYCAFIIYNDVQKLVSLGGVFAFLSICYALSVHRDSIQWNQIAWALLIQFAMANFVLKTCFGKQVFQFLGDKVTTFLNFSDKGSRFLFGEALIRESIFAFKVLPVIIFFSFTISILYHYGIMQVVVVKLGRLLQITIGTTPCESLSAAGNIFLGMTESPLLIKPYLALLTKSELFAIMTGGFATIAGSVLAAYINFGINAGHLISASVMAAPASLGISKLIYPETEESQTTPENVKMEKGEEHNALEAGANGASQAVKLCTNIAANIIALMAFLDFLDSVLIWFGRLISMNSLNSKFILSKLFIPVALIMGVPWNEADKVGELLGLKIFMSEFLAYEQLSKFMKDDTNPLSSRTVAISTFALCGFANICSVGIQIGGLGTMAPKRKSELAGMAFRAMIAGSIVTFINACMAGFLFDENSSHNFNSTLTVI